MSLMTDAKKSVTEVIRKVAEAEGIDAEKLRKRIAEGRITIPFNPIHSPEPLGVGEGLTVKVNANIGTSPDHADLKEEVEKAKMALKYGSDAVMDLSIGGDLNEIRRKLIEVVDKPFGTVPIYQAGIEA
ncbi:MAG: phosphomethylpyrimidine synthase ThiC, partial [Thermoplasmata archaeon]